MTELNLEALPQGNAEGELIDEAVGLFEVVLAPRSNLIGQTLSGFHFREKYNVNVMAIWRSGLPIRTHLSDVPLQFGDALLLQVPRKYLPVLSAERDLIVLNMGTSRRPMNRKKAWLSVAIMVVTLLLAASGRFSIGEVMLGGAIAMVLAGLLTMDQAYQAIDWKSIFLIAGMLPMGIALSKSGAAALIGDKLVEVLGPGGPIALLVGLILLTTLLTQVVNGAAVAAIIAPIAIGASQQIGVDPRSFAMGVALASSVAFITPLGHPVNVLVMGPGSYRFRDYLKVGLPLTILIIIAIVALLPIFWPLTD
jgi:di/tricarboxylate transporter